jgi:N-methylhydantoinase B
MPALRDLPDTEFAETYGCDRFTASVVASRFRYAIEHVCTQLIQYAFSPVIRESTDISAALSGPPSLDFAMPAVAQTIPVFFGSIPDAVRISLIEYGLDALEPGDVIIVNDPYRVGTHVNDVCFIRPVFHAGELIGAVTIRAHMLDWGGRALGGFEPTKVSTYEDGLVLSPTLLYSRGRPVRSTFSLIMDNTRFGPIVMPDIQTINSSLELGERLLLETVQRYGIDAYLGAIRYACDASAETMSAALEQLPDGVYEGEEWLDGDGVNADSESVVRVRVTVRGGRAEFDMSGSSPSTAAAINCSWADTKTAVSIALKYLIDPKSPYTSAALRDVDLLVPPGTLINPQPPHCTMFYWEPVLAITNAIVHALNPVLGDDAVGPDSWGGYIHMANGLRRDGSPWFSTAGAVAAPSGPWGATRHGDADSSQLMLILNLTDGGVEQAEADNPLVVLRHDYVPDTAGPGRYRSGAASVADTLWLAPGEHRVAAFHVRRPVAGGGANGGLPGTLAGGWLWDPAHSAVAVKPGFLPLDLSHPMYAESAPLMGVLAPGTQELDPDGAYQLTLSPIRASTNTVIRLLSSGAGGWGPPAERDPQLVLRDVRDGYVSVDGAARDYRVVVTGDPARDPEGLALDPEATAQLRDHIQNHGR